MQEYFLLIPMFWKFLLDIIPSNSLFLILDIGVILSQARVRMDKFDFVSAIAL